ncbi:GerAB/ArcD/ProY family transporter [Lysinibacillus sp. BW-2-10]|uniref:GerAB/ArcD/ProY family transporter n=1 Tax=Lysinibacillus sp. BW-2-10 TaxID=2590030 RepID=UPI001180B028|nr:GerAB/ArcD/ProY family transporter [Lysinibacillus sp. BW-2-10]TSI09673.1 GerAB/ArcD/ProY family transporter [Lysinibacillus sp. BW-2-10]
MKNTLHISNDQKINASLLFFIIVGCQIGVGIHGFQRVIYEHAKQDAWISLILSFLLAHFVVYIMMKTLDMYGSNDLYGINLDIFGKYFGNFLNLLYILYCSAAFFVIVKNYIEVINTWVFSYLSSVFLCLSILIIVIYAFTGGFKVMIGITFFSFFFLIWIPPILLIPLEYSDLNYILPILDNELKGILKGVLSMSFTIVGFEIINTVYPFIKDKGKYKRYVHLGMLFTLFLYLAVLLVSLTFFSGDQLMKTIWATLTLFGFIRLPFIERIEIITICMWMIIILPNLCLYMWSVYRGVRRMVNISVNKFVMIFSTIIFIANLFINQRMHINMLNNWFGKYAFSVVFIYPFILFLCALLKKQIKKMQVSNNEEN